MATTANYGWEKLSGSANANTIDDVVSAALDAVDSDLKTVDDVAAGAVAKSLYDANTVLYATTNDTPVALPVGASTVVGRKASGGIAAVTMAELRALLSPTPSTIATMGSTRTIDLNGDPSVVVEGTLDQASCAVTLTGFPANEYSQLTLYIVGSAGKTVTWTNTITWAGGFAPVISTSGFTEVFVFTLDGTNLRGAHGQQVRTMLWAPGNRGTAVTSASSGDFSIFADSRPVGGIVKLGTAGTVQSTIVDVNKNGTTMYTTQANRPTVATSTTSSGNITLPDVTTLTAGDAVSFDVDQFGTSAAGLSVTFRVLEAA